VINPESQRDSRQRTGKGRIACCNSFGCKTCSFTFCCTQQNYNVIYAVFFSQIADFQAFAGLEMPMTEDTSGAITVGIEAMKRIIEADLARR